MPRPQIKLIYQRMLKSSEIPIIESGDIISKGLYISEKGRKSIYIKQSLRHQDKLKVLLHEYSHYIHLTHYFKQESWAECEIIANSSALSISRGLGLKTYKEVDLSKFLADADNIKQITDTIQSVAGHILKEIGLPY